MLSCHLSLLILCYGLVFWILNFDCSFGLIAWYLYFFLIHHFETTCNHYIGRNILRWVFYLIISACMLPW